MAGYSYNNVIAYYLLTIIGRAFSSMPGLASGIARDIREGTVKKYLIQPIDMLGFLLLTRVAHKLVYYAVAAAPFALVFYLCRGYFPGWPDATTMVAFLCSLVMSFLLGFFLEATIGMIGFWFLEISSLVFVFMLFTFFFSGHMFPLDMLPGVVGPGGEAGAVAISGLFPRRSVLGKVTGAALAWGLAVELGWVVFFFIAARSCFTWACASTAASEDDALSQRPAYFRVFLVFARNSLVRDMTFRSNFIIEAVTSIAWMMMNLAFYVLIYSYTSNIAGWDKYQFFLFLATGLFINSLVQTFFMTNVDELSDQIRTGALDFALVKPIDAQFLVSLRRVDWSSLGNFFLGGVLAVYALLHVGYLPGPVQIVLYPVYVLCGAAIYYSLMIAMGSASVWMGRNLTLFDFWFYVTTFSRYPMEIYNGPWGTPLRQAFTFLIPVLIVVNVPARLLVRPLAPQTPAEWLLPPFAIFATLVSLAVSRWIFQRALTSYRSASSQP